MLLPPDVWVGGYGTLLGEVLVFGLAYLLSCINFNSLPHYLWVKGCDTCWEKCWSLP